MSSASIELPRRTIYTRLILVDHHDGPRTLVQRLDNGLVVFPGGAYQESDGDFIESTVRECDEEGSLSRGALRELRNFDLLWNSVGFSLTWTKGVDVYRMVYAPDDLYEGLGRSRDPEVVSAHWVGLRSVASGSSESMGRVPYNTRTAARIAVRHLPELFQYRLYLSTPVR